MAAAPSLLSRLPINRKEIFYTATLLPQIISANGFAHIRKFLDLFMPKHDLINEDAGDTISIISEYCLRTAIKGDAKTLYAECMPEEGHTPDLVVLLERERPLMLVIEGKMFERPNVPALAHQLKSQESHFIEQMKRIVASPMDVVHIALLPSEFAKSISRKRQSSLPRAVHVITWEQVADAFRNVQAVQQQVAALDLALQRWPDLVSKTTGEANADAKMTGEIIVAEYSSGVLRFQSMGRRGGLMGRKIQEDIATGKWKTKKYEVSFSDSPDLDLNQNWFLISSFVERLGSQAGI